MASELLDLLAKNTIPDARLPYIGEVNMKKRVAFLYTYYRLPTYLTSTDMARFSKEEVNWIANKRRGFDNPIGGMSAIGVLAVSFIVGLLISG